MAAMEPPPISVVMPAYNAGPFIFDAVRSILDQSFTEFEFIIIDDGSSDDTLAILKTFQDERIIVHRNVANLGVAASFNTGVAVARGEFVARFDADDIAEPNRLAVQHEFMKTHPGVTVCGADMTMFGDGTGATSVPPEDDDIKAKFMVAMVNILNPTAFFRRRFVMDHRIQCNPGYAAGEDLAFWIECMRRGATFANIKLPLVRYRIHANKLGNATNPRLRDIQAALAWDYFPHLTHSEVNAMMNIFDMKSAHLRRGEAQRTVAACEKAFTDSTSYFGENRRLLRELITVYLKLFVQTVNSSPAIR